MEPGSTCGQSVDALLREVSRSFYLTLRALPSPVRPAISLAYLLARATDTIADRPSAPVSSRLAGLATLARAIATPSPGPVRGQLPSAVIAPGTGDNRTELAERQLLARIDELLLALNRFPVEDQADLRTVLRIITSGQQLDLERFGSTEVSPGRVLALESDAELDDYTYRVAGCVGEFWTNICLRYCVRLDDSRANALRQQGVRFGKGLQLVNILRDVAADLRQGRCYLPAQALRTLRLEPKALLEPSAELRLRPLYAHYLSVAQDHLAAGWAYTESLPRAQVRLRLACAWPVLIGARTLSLLRHSNPLDPSRRVKVDRRSVRQIMVRTLLRYPAAGAWNRLFEEQSRG